ncbi:MAG: hypothetical protein PHO22_07660, partial [Mesotoga sp.]|nr:hypothetical protein [Mesotoga sp.]
VGDVRFAHEKMRAKIGTDNSPHVCPIFRVKGRNSNQDLFRANRRSPLQDLHDFESDHRSKTQPPALPLLPGAQAPASLPDEVGLTSPDGLPGITSCAAASLLQRFFAGIASYVLQ